MQAESVFYRRKHAFDRGIATALTLSTLSLVLSPCMGGLFSEAALVLWWLGVAGITASFLAYTHSRRFGIGAWWIPVGLVLSVAWVVLVYAVLAALVMAVTFAVELAS